MEMFTELKRTWLSCLVLSSLMLSSCSSLTIDWHDQLLVQALSERTDIPSGDGEGLAKVVPDHPLLVNNQLVFAIPGDAVLGIAMAVGAIDSTIDVFAELPDMALEAHLSSELEATYSSEQWQMWLSSLKVANQRLVLTPYCYLNGHPEAQLRGRIAMGEKTESGSVTFLNLHEVEGQRRQLEGEESWSGDNGQHLANDCRQLVTEVLQNLM